MLESVYQAKLIKKLKIRFPGCVVLKNDTDYIQGIPDLTILYKDMWALLEVKAAFDSAERPNQSYYVGKLGEMSFAAFIYPENEKEVLNALQRSFEIVGKARVLEREQVPLARIRGRKASPCLQRTNDGTTRDGTARVRGGRHSAKASAD